MRLEIDPADLEGLEPEIDRLQPWMHQYAFGPSTITGNFKYHGIAETCCGSHSPGELVARMREAFDDYLAGDPFWHLDRVLDEFGPAGTFLDIACASGKHSFHLIRRGAHSVHGVEIRPHQIRQCELVARSDHGCAGGDLRFSLDSTSADDPAFRSGETYDVVLSLGLLYHLTDPVQHLRNAARLARRALVLNTLTHTGTPGQWTLLFEDASWMTKAVGGISWVPHYADVPHLLNAMGFEDVRVLVHPLVRTIQEPLLRAAAASGRGRITTRLRRDATAAAHAVRLRWHASAAMRGYQNPAYFTYLALRKPPPTATS